MAKKIELGPILNALREKNNFTQQYMADYLKIGKTTYQAYEHGRAIPSLENLLLLAELFGLPGIDALLGIKKTGQYVSMIEEYNRADVKTKKIVNTLLKLQGS